MIPSAISRSISLEMSDRTVSTCSGSVPAYTDHMPASAKLAVAEYTL